MKRKVAILLAVVMTLSLFPASAFAATSNTLSKTTRTVVNDGYLFENGVLGSPIVGSYFDGLDLVIPLTGDLRSDSMFRLELTNADWAFMNHYTYPGTTEVNYDSKSGAYPKTYDPDAGIVAAEDLVYDRHEFIPYQDVLKYGARDWGTKFGTYYREFRNESTNSLQSASHMYEVPYKLSIDRNNANIATVEILKLEDRSIFTDTTYDYKTSFVVPTIAPVAPASGATAAELREYAKDVFLYESYIKGASASLISIYKYNTTTGSWEIRIPLVTKMTEDDALMTVEIFNGNTAINATKHTFASTKSGDTNTTFKEVIISRDEFALSQMIVTELRPQAIKNPTIVRLALPSGYHWILPERYSSTNTENQLKIGIQQGLKWLSNTSGNPNATVVAVPVEKPAEAFKQISALDSTIAENRNMQFVSFGPGNTYNQDKINFNNLSNAEGIDDTVLWIWVRDIDISTQLAGKLYFDGLRFYADDSAIMPTGDGTVDIKIHVGGGPVWDGWNKITDQSVLAAQRKDWNIGLKVTSSTIPTLVSGRYIGPSWSGLAVSNGKLVKDVDDNTHKTASIQMFEQTTYSWWGNRSTVLSVPETNDKDVKGAKFRLIRVTEEANVIPDIHNTNIGSAFYGFESGLLSDNGYFVNDGLKHPVHGSSAGTIMVDNNKITITNINVVQNKKASINFDLWVSLELGFGEAYGHDLKISVDPSSTSLVGSQSAAVNLPSVVIAHVYDPITVVTAVTDLKIGYQWQTTADIEIKEVAAGYLLKDKTVKLNVTDLISYDMYFTPDTTVQVTAGDLKIKNINAVNNNGFTSQSFSTLNTSVDRMTISFDIDRASTVASTVKIANIGVKLDRSVPVTNLSPYQVVVWGTAIAENYGLYSYGGKDEFGKEWGTTGTGSSRAWKADFATVGVYKDYIRVINAAPDEVSIFSQEVRVSIGSNKYIVNDYEYEMPTIPYISPASNSTMVPLRFVAHAFGLGDEKIVWDADNKTATIYAPNFTLQFKAGSTQVIKDGVSSNMLSPDNLPVSSEIKEDRMYLPFRALGVAFGVPVTWDDATKTAIYNENIYKVSTTPIPAQ